jgi:predicted ester cyclase
MSEQNKALAKRWFEQVWNNGSESAIHEMFHPEGHAYGFPNPESDLIDPDEFIVVHRKFKSAFSGIRIDIEDLIVDGDRAAIRWTSHMTHTGDGLGFAATNRQVALSGSSFIQIRDGKIWKGWNQMDFTALALQLQANA